MRVINEKGLKPIKIWTDDVEDEAMQQLRNMASMPFIAGNGIAVMPDVHSGVGSTIGSVIPTYKAIIPAACGVDIGCGMNAARTSLKASDLPESLISIRHQIERDVPLGPGGGQKNIITNEISYKIPYAIIRDVFKDDLNKALIKANSQLGTLGGGK